MKKQKETLKSLSSSDDEVESFPERLKAAIGSQSMRGFALDSGVSPTGMRAYLSGKSEPSRPALVAMARTAGVNVGWLAAGEGAALSDPGPETSGQTSDTELLPGVTKALIASVYDLMEHVIEEEGLEPTHEQKARFLANVTAYIGKEEIEDTAKQRDLIKLVVSNE